MTQHEPGMPIMVKIGGKDLELVYTLRVLKELQKGHDISVIRGGSDAIFDPEKLAVILWCGCKTMQPEITLDWIEDNVDTATLVTMMPSLVYAMTGQKVELNRSLPNLNGQDQHSTGSPSGPSGDTILASPNGNSGT